jgi:hypothetical protein
MKKTVITVFSKMVEKYPKALSFINENGGSHTFTVRSSLQNISPTLERELCGEFNE